MAKRKHPDKSRTGPKSALPGSLGEMLDEAGFKPLGRRIVIGRLSVCSVDMRSSQASASANDEQVPGKIVLEFANDRVVTIPARALRKLLHASDDVLVDVALQRRGPDVDHEIGSLIHECLTIAAENAGTRYAGSLESGLETSPWTGPVIEFLANNLPGDPAIAWENLYITAYELGCEALVALGQAEEVPGGARPLAHPQLPDVLPRWDDVATAVIYLATQNGLLQYMRFASGEVDDLHQPENIRASNGCGPAYAAPTLLPALRSLGLVEGERWTKAAETVLWRDAPVEWEIDFTKDPRFIEASISASEKIPEDIAEHIRSLAEITEAELADWRKVTTRQRGDKVRALVEKSWSYDLDALFYCRWRLQDGWLSSGEARRSLQIRHDALAIAMRKAFAAKCLPSFLDLAR